MRPHAGIEISIHAPRTGSDSPIYIFICSCPLFQSTLPARGATSVLRPARTLPQISIHAPRTGSDFPEGGFYHRHEISIHAPRTGSDHNPRRSLSALRDFNPRSPHGERRTAPRICTSASNFNPRSPHGERLRRFRRVLSLGISIHAPRTGSDGQRRESVPAHQISIHAPRTGSDSGAFAASFRLAFQSTLPARGATSTLRILRCGDSDFNPRSPHGERHQAS